MPAASSQLLKQLLKMLLPPLPLSHRCETFVSCPRRRFRDLPWLAGCCTYIRDREGGKVVLGPDGLPRVHYWPSKHDQHSILKVRIILNKGQIIPFAIQSGWSGVPHSWSNLLPRCDPD